MTRTFPSWSYRSGTGISAGADLVGYDVEATDGHIGIVDEASYDVDASYVVIDTGPWIFGRKILLPAGTLTRIEPADNRIHVDRTRDQIRNSPGFDRETYGDASYRQQVADYYDRTYRETPPL